MSESGKKICIGVLVAIVAVAALTIGLVVSSLEKLASDESKIYVFILFI